MDDEPINLTTVTALSLADLVLHGRTTEIRKAAKQEQERRKRLDQAEDLQAAIDALCEATEQRNELLNVCDRLVRLVETDKSRLYDATLQEIALLARKAIARVLSHKAPGRKQ
ncbi:MAG: hypothetical protein KGL39_30945 [Patescibacteria group bacterium]|nr:hypothetical protein [Patescibacteria group bacterium]